MRYRLRPVTEQDKEWLYALKIDAYRDVVERQFGWWDEDLQRRMFEDAWQPAAARVIVVSERDVGLLELANREGTLWIANIQLSSTARGQGLGSRIIQDLMGDARADGKPLRLRVLHRNDRARRLYQRLGFVQIGETDTHYEMQVV